MVERKRILAGRDVARIDAAQAVRFEMVHERMVTAARLGECAHPTQKRNQRRHCRFRRPVEVARDPLKAGTLAHVVLRHVVVTDVQPARC
jgi:hypothetical protein